MEFLNYEYPLDRDPKYLAFGFGDTLHYKASDMEDIEEKQWMFMISSTWKERHAKGVPVKMIDTEWFKCIHESPNIEPAFFGYGTSYGRDSNVYVGFYEPQRPSPYATFCNFRYKQSWLDKKGGEHA